MTISVITPLSSAGNPFIGAAYDSLKAQAWRDFEWVVLCNKGGQATMAMRADPRVKLFREEHEGIGRLKRRACELSTGNIIVELDHDDWIWPTALERVAQAVEAGGEFLYSDFAEVLDGSFQPNTPYRADCGWRTYPVEWEGRPLLAHRSAPATPQNLRYIDFAPNHLRGWTRKAYESAGGHNPEFKVGDDHDLMVRMYLAGHRFAHIPECLYGYRVHKLNTVRTDNAAIRQATERVYNKYIWALAEKFAQDGGFSKVDLCGGIDNPPSYEPYDLTLGHDLNKTWPIPDNSVGVLRAYDAVEHLRDNVFTMNESFRVLTPGGFMCISVPSTDGRGAWQDSSHVSFWNQNTMFYWTDRRFARYLPEFKGRFAVSRVITWFPSDWHREFQCPYVEAQLIKLGAPYEHMGPAPI